MTDAFENPYSSPTTLMNGDAPNEKGAIDAAEESRRTHLRHEIAVKTVGALYHAGGVFNAAAALSIIFPIATAPIVVQDKLLTPITIGVVALYSFLAVVSFYLGKGLWQFIPNARIAAGIYCVCGIAFLFLVTLNNFNQVFLSYFAIATIVNFSILYLLLCEKGKFIFSPQYKEIIANTRSMDYSPPESMLFLLFVLASVSFIFLVFIPLFLRGQLLQVVQQWNAG